MMELKVRTRKSRMMGEANKTEWKVQKQCNHRVIQTDVNSGQIRSWWISVKNWTS